MDRRGSMVTERVEEDEVREMKASQIFQLATSRGLDLSGCNNTDDFRDRVLLDIRLQNNRHYDLQREFGNGPGDSLDSTKQALDNLLETVQTSLTYLSPTMEQTLNADCGDCERSESLVKQIERRRQNLMSSDCSVIVAGETNAGKSTFLNLLLGMDVLPTSIFSCTAAVCVLRHSDTFQATVHFKDGTCRSADFKNAADTKEWLDGEAAEKKEERRIEGLNVRTIHVHLPAAVLQSGVTLVDTPGIGENEAMTRCTMDYVQQHSAAAYLYVIKTDNAGGVHEDRLLDFLRAILHHNEQTRTADTFNPAAAMFVCNRWDQVERSQRGRVRDNALHKLRGVWPRFQSSQVFFVSSTNAQMHYDADPRYISEDYERVLRGLKDTYVQARCNAVNQHYRWIKQFLHATTSFLQTAVHHCAMSDEQLQERFRTTRNKLQALQKRTASTINKLRHHVEQGLQRLCEAIRVFLLQEGGSVRAQLMDWSLQPLPQAPTAFGEAEDSELTQKFKCNQKVSRWKEEVDTLIMRRIIDTVEDQVRQRGLDTELQMSLRRLFQEDLQLVDEEINSIQSDMRNSDDTSLCSSISSNSSCMSTDSDEGHALELLRLSRQGPRFSVGQLKHISRVARNSASSISSRESPEATLSSVPKVKAGVLLRKVVGPLATLFKLGKARRASQFGDRPEEYMRHRTEKMVAVVCETPDCLQQMVSRYHDQMDAFVSDVESSIPTFIANSKQQMDDLRANKKNYLSQRNELVSLMEQLEPVRDMLRGFGDLYIRDLTADNVCFTLNVEQRRQSVEVKVKGAQRCKTFKDSGLGDSFDGMDIVGIRWTSFRKGHVTIGNERHDVMGRTYLQPPSEQYLIKEIARLRCLRNEHLAVFLGVSRQQEGAIFLFGGNLRTARRFLSRGFHKPRESVPRLLEGVVGGLHYLHRQGLGHMDLSLDTIMVNVNGEPRLCGAGLPRYALLPPDPTLIFADSFVCLSPEVLHGELYTADDDVYSFGLVVWETCLGEKPYSQYRTTMKLQEFRNQVHPAKMLDLDRYDHLSETMTNILRGCLLPARGLRLKTEALKELVSQLRSDPLVNALSTATRRDNVVHKRSMGRGSSEDPPPSTRL